MSNVAIDIGATNIRVAVGDIKGLKKKVMEPTETRKGPNGVSQQIFRLIDSIRDDTIGNIGIGSIGPINLNKGMITNTPNYSFNNIPIAEPLQDRYNIPVKIVNDCAAAVLGEQVFGAGKGLENLVYVTLSTGLGGGAIIDNNLLLGKDGNAVEVGHFTIDPESDIICGCGCRGHWEAFCSGKNIPVYAGKLLKEIDWSSGELYKLTEGNSENIETKIIFNAAYNGDIYAQYIIQEIGKRNAIGFGNIVNAYDPELITIGGSIALNNPDFILEPIQENIGNYTINRIPKIKITPLGDDAVLLGALALSLRI